MAIPGLVKLIKNRDHEMLFSIVTALAELADHGELQLSMIAM